MTQRTARRLAVGYLLLAGACFLSAFAAGSIELELGFLLAAVGALVGAGVTWGSVKTEVAQMRLKQDELAQRLTKVDDAKVSREVFARAEDGWQDKLDTVHRDLQSFSSLMQAQLGSIGADLREIRKSTTLRAMEGD